MDGVISVPVTPEALRLMGFEETVCKRGAHNGVFHKDLDGSYSMTFNTRTGRFHVSCADSLRRVSACGHLDTVNELDEVLMDVAHILHVFRKPHRGT